jgi:acyl-CoA hydrolase
MSWGEIYRQKVTTAERAVAMIRSGDRVYIHIACAVPTVLVDSLMSRGDSLQNVEIVDLVALYNADFGAARWAGHFRHNALFIGAGCREAVGAGRGDYTPIFLSEVERLFTSGALPLDVALIQLWKPRGWPWWTASGYRWCCSAIISTQCQSRRIRRGLCDAGIQNTEFRMKRA